MEFCNQAQRRAHTTEISLGGGHEPDGCRPHRALPGRPWRGAGLWALRPHEHLPPGGARAQRSAPLRHDPARADRGACRRRLRSRLRPARRRNSACGAWNDECRDRRRDRRLRLRPDARPGRRRPVLLRRPRPAPGVQRGAATRTRCRSTSHSSNAPGGSGVPTRRRASSREHGTWRWLGARVPFLSHSPWISSPKRSMRMSFPLRRYSRPPSLTPPRWRLPTSCALHIDRFCWPVAGHAGPRPRCAGSRSSPGCRSPTR